MDNRSITWEEFFERSRIAAGTVREILPKFAQGTETPYDFWNYVQEMSPAELDEQISMLIENPIAKFAFIKCLKSLFEPLETKPEALSVWMPHIDYFSDQTFRSSTNLQPPPGLSNLSPKETPFQLGFSNGQMGFIPQPSEQKTYAQATKNEFEDPLHGSEIDTGFVRAIIFE